MPDLLTENVIKNNKSLSQINIRKGIAREFGEGEIIPLSPSAQVAVAKLTSYLGELSNGIIPRFIEIEGKAQLLSLDAVPHIDGKMSAAGELNKLLPGAGLPKTKPFDAVQTQAILARLPNVDLAKLL